MHPEHELDINWAKYLVRQTALLNNIEFRDQRAWKKAKKEEIEVTF